MVEGAVAAPWGRVKFPSPVLPRLLIPQGREVRHAAVPERQRQPRPRWWLLLPLLRALQVQGGHCQQRC